MKLFLLPFFCFFTVVGYTQNDSSNHYATLGKQAFGERKYLVAERNFTKSLKFDPKNTLVLIDLADAYYEMRKYGNAIQEYKNIITLDANNAVALEKLSTLCFMSRQWTETITYAKQCIEKKIGDKMHYKIAKSYYELEDYMQSSKYLQTASKEDATNADIPYTMANIWAEMNQAKKALEMYAIALSMDSSKSQWYDEVASIYNDIGDFPNAIINYEKAVAKGMQLNTNLNLTLGLLYIQVGQYAKGETMVQTVVAKKPMDKTLYNDIGYAYYSKEKYAEAIKWWDEILRIDKQDAKALYMIGIAFRKSGDEAKGNHLCDAAIALDPNLASLKKQMMPPQGMGL
jgi:tetratricopeptide (TPR) repeat protein